MGTGNRSGSRLRGLRIACMVLSALGVVRGQSPEADDDADAAAPRSDQPRRVTLEDVYVAAGDVHRARFDVDDPRYAELRAKGAVVRSFEYGAFTLAFVDARRMGGRDGLARIADVLADDMGLLAFDGALFDTAEIGGYEARANLMRADLRARPIDRDQNALFLVQFAGPVQEAWLEAAAQAGARIVSYLPANAYVVSVGASDFARWALFGKREFVSWSGRYEPWAKLEPEFRDASPAIAADCDVVVQVVSGADGAELLGLMQAAFPDAREIGRDGAFTHVALTAPAWTVPYFARHEAVFAVERRHKAEILDERQARILTRNTSPNDAYVTVPGHLQWLANHGFQQSGQFDFVVDVTDSGVDKGSTVAVDRDLRVGGASSGASRVVYAYDYTTDPVADDGDGHGTLVSSVIAGFNQATGAEEDALGFNHGLGICPFVPIGNSKVFSNSPNGIGFLVSSPARLAAAYQANARISNNSWGYKYSLGGYNADCRLHDLAVRDVLPTVEGVQPMTIIFAAGNSGNSGATTVAAPSTAKNVICVGASEVHRPVGADGCGSPASVSDNATDLHWTSSRGPCTDGRLKPDVVAPGSQIMGLVTRSPYYTGVGWCDPFWPYGQTRYFKSSGTSFSAPAVSGAAALYRQAQLNSGMPAPSPALTKAALMATASHLTGNNANDSRWSPKQGMGLVNLKRLFRDVPVTVYDQSHVFTQSGQTWAATGAVAMSNRQFHVGLVWTDAPGSTVGNAWVNDLDLAVTVGGTTYKGNVFSGAYSVPGGVADRKNNAEFVVLPVGTTGPFTIRVTAASIGGDGVPGGPQRDQDFALYVFNS